MKTLVVDDSKVMRLMVIRALRQAQLAKFDCDEAPDGKTALEMFNEGDYQIVFVDFNMPHMNGLEFVEQVRASGKSDVPIAMITSEKTASIQQQVEEAGANAYISKPFTPDQLRDALEPLIEAIEG